VHPYSILLLYIRGNTGWLPLEIQNIPNAFLNTTVFVSLDEVFFICYEKLTQQLYSRCPSPSPRHGTLTLSRNFVTSRCIAWFGTALSGYALLNAKRSPTNNLDVKQCPRMNTRSAPEYTTFTRSHLLRNWRDQRPSNKGDLESCVTAEGERIYYTALDQLVISCFYRSVPVLLSFAN
jgi:hypothetical protein